MKSKLIMICVASSLMIGCSQSQSIQHNDEIAITAYPPIVNKKSTRLFPTTKEFLYYDKETFVIYYYFRNNSDNGYLSPFYSENGRLVKYNIENKSFDEIN